MGVKGTPNVRRRPIARGALGALVGRRMDACTPSVIPAEAGIQAICGGQGHSQCSTAPDRALARSGLWWAVGWMPVPPPSFLRRQESRRSVGVKGTPNVRRRPIARGALGALVGRRMDACTPSVIPAEAGIQANCDGVKGTPRRCSTDGPIARRAGRSGGPSGGWGLVARLGGRMDSCLRRNDGQGRCDGQGRA